MFITCGSLLCFSAFARMASRESNSNAMYSARRDGKDKGAGAAMMMFGMCMPSLETAALLHAFVKVVFLVFFVLLVTAWPSISLITLISLHGLFAIVLLVSWALGWNSAASLKVKAKPANAVHLLEKDNNAISDSRNLPYNSWTLTFDSFTRMAVFHLEEGHLTTVNIVYIIILVANLNAFFQHQTSITPPYTLRPIPKSALATDPLPAIGKVDHYDFQSLDKELFKFNDRNTYKDFASVPLAQQGIYYAEKYTGIIGNLNNTCGSNIFTNAGWACYSIGIRSALF